MTEPQILDMIDNGPSMLGVFDVLEDVIRKKWVLRLRGGPGSPMLSWQYDHWRLLADLFEGHCYVEDGAGDTDTVLFHSLEAACAAQLALSEFGKLTMRVVVRLPALTVAVNG